MDVFSHGVASGDPSSGRVVLWTRASAPGREAVRVRCRVARDPGLRDVVFEEEALARPNDDHTVHVDAGGLEPGQAYFYAFDALGARSPVGRTRTAPGRGVERLSIAVVSCAKYTAGYFNAYARIAERRDLDLVLHLGDYIYESGNDDPRSPGPAVGRGVAPAHALRTLADYRARYAHYRRDPDLQRLHLAHPLVATLDDHDICDNAWRDGAGGHDPERDGDWHARKAAALRAWREWTPARLPDPSRPERVYRSLHLGDLAELVLLDGRTQRDPPAGRPGLERGDRSMLGAEQFGWLVERLEDAQARWTLVGNGVMLAPVYSELVAEELGDPLGEVGILAKRDHGPDPDQWDGYPAERERLLRAIEARAAGDVVVLSGDVHTSWAVDLGLAGDVGERRAVAVELVTPSVTSENLDEHLGTSPGDEASERVERHIASLNPHVRWCDLDRHGYVLLDVRRERVRADWWFVADVRRRCEEELFGAAFEALAGERRLRRIAADDGG